jgi:hypothetical protein
LVIPKAHDCVTFFFGGRGTDEIAEIAELP